MRGIITFAAAAFLVVLLSIASFIVRGNNSRTLWQSQDLVIENKTARFFVLSAVRNGSLLRLGFRNGYSQTINGFTIASGPSSGVQVDLTDSDHEIMPGAEYYYQAPATNFNILGSGVAPLRLTILNVVFDDGTSDGDDVATSMIQMRRMGEKVAFIRILPLLDEFLREQNETDRVEDLKSRISIACNELTNQQPKLARGIEHGKGYLLSEIDGAAHNRATMRGQLQIIEEHYRKQVGKLERIVPQR